MPKEATGPITADSVVQEVVDRYPQTIRVFVRRRLNCVSCYIAPFHTLTDTAREHDVGVDLLVQEMNQAAVSETVR